MPTLRAVGGWKSEVRCHISDKRWFLIAINRSELEGLGFKSRITAILLRGMGNAIFLEVSMIDFKGNDVFNMAAEA